MSEVLQRRHETLGWRAVIGVLLPTFGGLNPVAGELDMAVICYAVEIYR